MIVEISNYHAQNIIFFTLLALAVFLTLRKRGDRSAMSIDSTAELKGLAILAVVLAHVGFGIAGDNRFISPLSTWAGVAVNVFFFLSGFGLALSALKKDLSIKQFYLKRLSKVIVPLWIFLAIILLLDKFALGLSYPAVEMVQAFFGFFPRADLYTNINPPLWFLTPLIFYYLIFPIISSRKLPEISALVILAIGYLILKFTLPIHPDMKNLWLIHYQAFPLGMLFAALFYRFKTKPVSQNFLEKVSEIKNIKILKYLVLSLLVVAWLYLFQHSGVGQTKIMEQSLSLVALLITVFIFMVKPVESRFLLWLGAFSYEIYLLHWPLMYRYDFIFKFLPAGVALLLYLIVFIIIGKGILMIRDHYAKIGKA